jgi:hypothetical protein
MHVNEKAASMGGQRWIRGPKRRHSLSPTGCKPLSPFASTSSARRVASSDKPCSAARLAASDVALNMNSLPYAAGARPLTGRTRCKCLHGSSFHAIQTGAFLKQGGKKLRKLCWQFENRPICRTTMPARRAENRAENDDLTQCPGRRRTVTRDAERNHTKRRCRSG